ncbi:MAG: hypothetical protein MI673_05185 [Thiotrichales bacterium]|nr:hypothetical protein [Thiotrichales bacterium]
MQIPCYAGFMFLVGFLSMRPEYRHIQPDEAFIKLSFSHSGKREDDCVRLTSEEIMALPPHERKPFDCQRSRLPVYVELQIDNRVVLERILMPGGISRDGASSIYHRVIINSGEYRITARLRDSQRDEGFDYEKSENVEIRPGQNYVIDFREEDGGFIFNRS